MEKQIKTMEVAGKTFRLYNKLAPSVAYLIGVNVADRVGDTSTIAILHPCSMKVVAVYKSKLVGIETLQKILSQLTSNVIPHSTICVIRNSTGLKLLDDIIRSGDACKQRLYYEDDGILKRYGVDGNKSHALIDLNGLLSVTNVNSDDILAISAATYVYIRNKKRHLDKLEESEKSNDLVFQTKNQSFIDMAEYLKSKKVKNYDFMLAINNKDLIGVNPNDPNLSPEIKDAIIKECTDNPWYFFREVLLVGNTGGYKTPFELNRGNTAMIWLFFKGIDTLTYLSRDSYKTTTALAILTYLMIFDKGNRATIGSPKPYISTSLLSKMSSMYESLPTYMQYGRDYAYDSKEEVSILYHRTNTKVNTYRSYATESEAETVAKGVDAPVQFFDDIDSIEHFDKFYKYSLRPYIVNKEKNESRGKYTARIMTSVPGDLSKVSAQFSDWLYKNAVLFTEEMYDLTDEELNIRIKTIGDIKLVVINMNYLDLGKSQKWYDEHCECLNNDEDAIRRELLLERYAGKTGYIKPPNHIKWENDTQIDITLSRSMKEKLVEMAKSEGVTVEMLINQILAMEIGRFDK